MEDHLKRALALIEAMKVRAAAPGRMPTDEPTFPDTPMRRSARRGGRNAARGDERPAAPADPHRGVPETAVGGDDEASIRTQINALIELAAPEERTALRAVESEAVKLARDGDSNGLRRLLGR